MKLLALTILTCATAAFACPNFQGTWQCKNTDGSEQTEVITQSSIPNGMLYKMADKDGATEIYADGSTRKIEKPDHSETTTVSCDADSAIFGTVDFHSHDTLLGHLDFKYTLLSPNEIHAEGKVKTNNGDQEINFNCQKK